MDEFLRNSPKWLIVGGALALALVIMMVLNPPYSACDSQFDVFKNSETPFLYLDPTKKFMTETDLQRSRKICEERNLPGSCFQMFEGLRLLVRDLETVSFACQAHIIERAEVKCAVFESVSFIVKLAWGLVPPQSYLDKTGWLDSVHLGTFCDLHGKIKEYFSDDEWANYREEILKSLPGSDKLDRKELWNRSLFSLKCP